MDSFKNLKAIFFAGRLFNSINTYFFMKRKHWDSFRCSFPLHRTLITKRPSSRLRPALALVFSNHIANKYIYVHTRTLYVHKASVL